MTLSCNFVIGDVALLKEDTLVSARWPIARVVKTYEGGNGLVRVVDLKELTNIP